MTLAERIYREAFKHPDHLCNGKCPDEGEPGMESRDPKCFYCSVMTLAQQTLTADAHARATLSKTQRLLRNTQQDSCSHGRGGS